jgi:hypothetical protein
MALSRLIYSSRANMRFTDKSLAELVRASSQRNALRDVTGTLVYSDGVFVQMLEGEESEIRALFNFISIDRRHRSVRELSCQPISTRAFAGWGMSFLHEQATQRIELAKIREALQELDPVAGGPQIADAVQKLLIKLKNAIDEHSTAAAVQRAA